MTALRRWLLILALVALTVSVSYFWIDRPLAAFLHDQRPHIPRILAQISDPLIWIAAITFFALGLLTLAGRPLSKMHTALLLCSLSLLVAETIKNYLKFVFGRTWPETWYQNNPSFIHDGIYGFNWFHEGAAYQSFPSGHMTTVGAVVSVLWIYYPQLRVLYLIFGLIALVGLVGGNFHFLSDAIAGAFVGASTGTFITILFARLPSASIG